MSFQNKHDDQRPVTKWLHPGVYAILAALAAWFVLAIWSFAGSGIVDYLLFIVSVFIGVTLALPFLLARVGRTINADPPRGHWLPWRSWRKYDYDTWGGRLRGAEAATQILLPVAAAAIGMTVIGLIYVFAGHPVA